MRSMWYQTLQQTLCKQDCVLVTVAEIKGSAPRAIGSRMLVTSDRLDGSIGGGNLEFEATLSARKLLADAYRPGALNELYGLGPKLNQCCGGAVTLLYEVFNAAEFDWLEALQNQQLPDSAVLVTAIDNDNVGKWIVIPTGSRPAELPQQVHIAALSLTREENAVNQLVPTRDGRYLLEVIRKNKIKLYLFGAGHVGTALVRSLQPLPVEITWLDSRPDQFPANTGDIFRKITLENPSSYVDRCEPGSVFLVMTHSHQLDEDICYKVLSRNDMKWLGLIGSVSKRRRFINRLKKRGIDARTLEKLICPIGLSGISGKRPATIAVAVAAQLLNEVIPQAWR